MPTQPLVSIITLNFNNLTVTLEFLKSISKIDYPNYEVILVDNGSENFKKDIITRDFPSTIIVESTENLGFAGGNNLGLDKAQGEYVFFVNNDIEIDADGLDVLMNTIPGLKNLGAISPKFHFYHTKNLIEYAGCSQMNLFTARTKTIGKGMMDDGSDFQGVIETSYVHGGGMLVPRHVIDTVGPMAVDYFLYYEELDWSERIRRAGFKIYCQRDAIIYHKESASIGRLSPLKTYFMNRSRILFMRKNYSGLNLMPFYLFYTFISFPKNIVKYSLSGNLKHLKAYLRSLLWQVNPKYKY